MPELPEIETIKRVIEPQIKNLAIKSVIVNRSEVVEHKTANEFCEKISDRLLTVWNGKVVTALKAETSALMTHVLTAANIVT